MPIFFKRNLDPFGDKSLHSSWVFRTVSDEITVDRQQLGNKFNISSDDANIIDSNRINEYNTFNTNVSDDTSYETENDLPYSSYSAWSGYVIVDCNVADGKDYDIYLISDGENDFIRVTVDNKDNSDTTNKITVDDGYSTYTIDCDLGYHSICVTYDYNISPSDLNIYIDGELKETLSDYDEDDGAWLNDSPLSIYNIGHTTYGITDIEYYTKLLSGNEVLQLHDNSFLDLADRTLDPFEDGSLVTAFRGVNNSTSDDELVFMLDSILPPQI